MNTTEKITGKHLIDLGYKPDAWFKVALSHINDNGLRGEEMESYLKSVCPPPPIEPFSTPQPYHINIRAEHPEEEENMQSVLETMDVLMTTPTLVNGAIMPDACPTGEKGQIPVGGVVAAKNAIHPAMHSADICCSVMMTSFGETAPKDVLDMAHKQTHFGWGGRDEFSDLPVDLLDKIKSNPFLNDDKSIHLRDSRGW